MAEEKAKKHLSIVICGHVDAGKSTTTGRLIFELGGIPERKLAELKKEAEALGKGSFAFAFYMDKSKEERARGVTIACTTTEFYTDSYHYTIIDAPGHRDFIKNMITGASQADVALLMVPADGNFTAAIAKGNHKDGIVPGQTRQHSRIIKLLGVKQIIVGVNKIDVHKNADSQAKYKEITDEMTLMMNLTGWGKQLKNKEIPMLPLSGWEGHNILKPCTEAYLSWYKGCEVAVPKEKVKGDKKDKKDKKASKFDMITVHTLYDCLEKMVKAPKRKPNKPFRVPVSGVYKIKGVGDVVTGRVEQGKVQPNTQVVFLPTHTASKACKGKVFTVEMHHKSVPEAGAGDNVGMNIKNLSKENMPRVGDIMIDEKDDTLKACQDFTAEVQILDHPGELKPGYTPIAYVRTGRCPVKMTKIHWWLGKATGGQQAANPPSVKAGYLASVTFEPQQPFVVDTEKNCEGLARVAIMEGNGVVMLGNIKEVTFKA